MANSTLGSIKFISWNVKGLGTQVKTSRVLNHLFDLKSDVMFLQETHLTDSDLNRVRRPWIGKTFHACFSSGARGASIIIRKEVAFTLDDSCLDPGGRFVIISSQLHEHPVVMACIYAPNWDDESFFTSFFSSLAKFENRYLILAGDFNLVQDSIRDRSS